MNNFIVFAFHVLRARAARLAPDKCLTNVTNHAGLVLTGSLGAGEAFASYAGFVFTSSIDTYFCPHTLIVFTTDNELATTIGAILSIIRAHAW